SIERPVERNRVVAVVVPGNINLASGTHKGNGADRATGTMGIIGARGAKSGAMIRRMCQANTATARAAVRCIPCDVNLVFKWTSRTRVHRDHRLIIEMVGAA